MPTSLIAMAASLATQPPRTPAPMQQPSAPVAPPFATIQVPPPAPAPPPATPPALRRPQLLSGSISAEDYPAAAIRDEAEGTVHAMLEISATGTVTSCEVLRSAGHAVLDARTCELLTERLRFQPARASGAPVPHIWVQQVRWQMPGSPLMIFAQGRFDWTVTVSPAGATECRIEVTGAAFEAFDEGQCADADGDRMGDPDEMGAGHPPTRLRNVLSLLPEGERATLPRLSGVPRFEWTGQVEIDPSGRVTNCSTIATQGAAPDYAYFTFRNGCASVMGRPLFAAEVDAPVRRARLGSTLFVEAPAPPR